jgi:hypothetical protein
VSKLNKDYVPKMQQQRKAQSKLNLSQTVSPIDFNKKRRTQVKDLVKLNDNGEAKMSLIAKNRDP